MKRPVFRGTKPLPGVAMLREALLALLVALLFVAGLAALRAKAESVDGGGLRHGLALCLSGEDGAPAPDHDCDSCRLGPAPALVPPFRSGAALVQSHGRILPGEAFEQISAPGRSRPWSRGPPGVA